MARVVRSRLVVAYERDQDHSPLHHDLSRNEEEGQYQQSRRTMSRKIWRALRDRLTVNPRVPIAELLDR